MKNSELPFIILITVAMAAWGASWVSAKFIAGITEPAVLIFWRYLITAIAFLPILLIRKERFRINIKEAAPIFGSALFLSLYSHCFFGGLKNGLPGAGGVLLTTLNPLFTYLITALLFRKRPHVKEILGLFVGFVGGFFLLKLWQFDMEQLLQSGNGLFLLGALLWSILSLFSHEAQKSVTVFVYAFYVNLVAALFMLPTVTFSKIAEVFTFPLWFWGNLLFLSLIATTFATTAYFLGTKRLGPAKGSSFVFLVPVFAMVFSFIFRGEVPQWNTLVGGAMTIGAVMLIHRKKR